VRIALGCIDLLSAYGVTDDVETFRSDDIQVARIVTSKNNACHSGHARCRASSPDRRWITMIVLGFSGFENSIPFKKAHWPGLDEREYRISQGHDSAAALVVDGEIVAAAAEERFSRKKHTGDFPEAAIRYCLRAAGIDLNDVDEVAHSFDYSPYRPMFLLDAVSSEQFQSVFSRESLLERLHRAFRIIPPIASFR
jgi:Carbamoyltransferase N-terminus